MLFRSSRVRSLNDLVILRPFEHKKISCRPSEDYRIEKQRLSLLATLPSVTESSVSIDPNDCDLNDHELLSRTQSEIVRLAVDDSRSACENLLNKKRPQLTDMMDDNIKRKRQKK